MCQDRRWKVCFGTFVKHCPKFLRASYLPQYQPPMYSLLYSTPVLAFLSMHVCQFAVDLNTNLFSDKLCLKPKADLMVSSLS
jgi:hypothetical protein